MIYAFLASLLFAIANGAWLIRRLEQVHPSIWIKLGQPKVSMRNGVRPRVQLIQYIWSLQFKKLNDSPLAFACYLAITAELLLIVLLPGLVFNYA